MCKLSYDNLEDNIFEEVGLDKLMGLINSASPVPVFFAFETCPWCVEYINYLNDTAKDWEIDTIYYFNPKQIGLMNTDNGLKNALLKQYYEQLINCIGALNAAEKECIESDNAELRKFSGIYVPVLYIFQEGKVLGSYSGPDSHDLVGDTLPVMNDLQKEELVCKYKGLLSLVK